jgi:CRP-like cAMP-binding protein
VLGDGPLMARFAAAMTDLRFEPGATVYAGQDEGQFLYTVRRGVVRLERVSEGGERRILRLAGPADLFGLEAALGQRYSADAVACTELALCRVPRAVIEELSRDEPELLRGLMKRWQRALDDAEEWLAELATGAAHRRMLRLLLKLSEHAEPDGLMWLPMRDEMGAMLGMTVETASRLVSTLRREGVVQAAGPRLARIDMGKLLAALKQADHP